MTLPLVLLIWCFQALEAFLPPKRSNPEPLPEIVVEADFEEGDIADVRSRSFPASPNFFDQFAPQFGDDEDDWVEEDDDEDDSGMRPQPECQQQ